MLQEGKRDISKLVAIIRRWLLKFGLMNVLSPRIMLIATISAKDHLLAKLPIVPGHVHPINDTLTAEKAANDYKFVIRHLVRTRVINVSNISDCPKFDLILLGMGPDGHMASLFPNHLVLEEQNEWVTFITDRPKPPPERITFTLPVINSAANVVVVATGGGKTEAACMAIDDLGLKCPVLPARMVQPCVGKFLYVKL